MAVAGGCGDGGGFPDAAVDSPPPGPGAFTLAWTVTDANQQPITCGQIGATAVTATLRNLAASGGQTEVFTCATGSGMSQKDLTPGTYEIMFELDAGNGTVLQTAPTLHGIVIQSNQVTALAPISFAVQATGGMKLHLSANKPGGNCAAAPNGAAIDAMTISVQHQTTGPCEPIMFAIAAGATQPAGTYTINCTTPASAPCIDSDQELTAVGIPSDKYTFHIQGNTAGATCWTNNDQVTVPPLDGTLTTTLNLGHAPAGTPGC
jgi:hypothetical protein